MKSKTKKSKYSSEIYIQSKIDKLTDNQIESIERGLKDVKEGRVIPHEEVMKRIKEKFGF